MDCLTSKTKLFHSTTPLLQRLLLQNSVRGCGIASWQSFFLRLCSRIHGRVFLRIFTFLYRIRRFVSELIEYACINTRKSRASIREKRHHYQRAKTWWTWRVISVIAENKPLAHHKTHLHTMKVYNTQPVSLTIEVLLITIFLCFQHLSINLFQSHQSFQVIEFVDRIVPEELEIFCINLSYTFFTKHAWHLENFYRAFSLTLPASMQNYWNKRKRLHKKRIQLPQDCLGTPTWPPWRHVKTLLHVVS